MKTFLGRSSELAAIDQAIRSFNQSVIVSIYGQGGIGKTRLLREVYLRYQDVEPIVVLDLIDFDLPRYDFLQVIGNLFNTAFPTEFSPYREADYLRHRIEEGVLDTARLSAAQFNVERALIDCVNVVAANKRIVLLFDTVEKAVTRYTFTLLLRVFAAFQNTVFLFAGRQSQPGPIESEPLQQQIAEAFNHDVHCVNLNLEPFDGALSIEYIRRTELPYNLQLDATWQAKINFLATGRPIIIDLAVESASRHDVADWFRDEIPPLATLQALQQSADPEDRKRLSQIQRRFDQELLWSVSKQRSPLDRITILLLYVSPLRRSDVVSLLDLEPIVVDRLFDIAGDSAPYKLIGDELLSLHDVARDLLMHYIVPEIDPDGERKAQVLSQAISIFNHESEWLAEQISQAQTTSLSDPSQREQFYQSIRAYQQLRARIAEYRFQLDPLHGVRTLEAELRTIVRFQGIPGDIAALYEAIRSHLPAVQQLSPDDYWNVHIVLADAFVKSERYDHAKIIYESLEDRLVSQPLERRIAIATHRGTIEMATGEVRKALSYYQESAALAEKSGNRLQQARALLSCGWASRPYGTLLQPAKYYQQALRLVMGPDADSPESRQIQATALNGMSYIYAIDKKREAQELLSRAIEIRRSMGPGGRYQLGQSYTTAGEVYCELDNPNEALKYLDLAEQIFKELDKSHISSGTIGSSQSSQWFGKVYSAKGRSYSAIWEKLRQDDPDRANQALQQAEQILLIAQQQAIAADLPRALQRLGFVYAATPERRSLAVATWLRAYHHAAQFGDLLMEFNIVGNLAQMATYGHVTEQFADLAAFDHWYIGYQARSGGVGFESLNARFNIYRGALALQAGDAMQAFSLLDNGLSELERRQLDVSYNFRWQLDYLEYEIFPGCDPAVVQSVAQRLTESWMERGIGVAFWERFAAWSNRVA